MNIFSGIVNSENTMTELLCNFMAFKPFREAFIKLFFENISHLVSFDNFQTQYTTDINKSRPDMAIMNDECEFLIEIKTWDTYLTGNQPNSYLDYINKVNKKFKSLIFLVPSNYSHLSEWQAKVSTWKKVNKSDICIKTIFWNEIINIIKQNDLHLISDRFNDFYELLKSWFEIDPIVFSGMEVNYMFNSEIPKILTKLYSIIDEVKDYCSQIYSVSKSMNNQEYGVYIKNRDDKKLLLYLGIWYPFWEKYGCPLCYGVDTKDWTKDIIKKFSEAHKDKVIEMN